ncbi:Protein DEHYDRATION-INDUCED 19 5 [Glycine soja]
MTKECNSPKEQQPQVLAIRKNLEKLKLELHNINRGIQSYILRQRVNGTWGAPRYVIGEEDDTESNGDDDDDDARSLLQCPSCDFEIDFSSAHTHLEEMHCYDPKNLLCPVCDETLGEEAIWVAQNSSAQKRAWKSDKSSISISSGDSVVVLEKKLPARGSKHEPVPDPVLSPFVRNVSVPNSSGIHPGEGSSRNATYISNAKGSGTDAPQDSGDEQDIEERRLRASFVQELLSSALI